MTTQRWWRLEQAGRSVRDAVAEAKPDVPLSHIAVERQGDDLQIQVFTDQASRDDFIAIENDSPPPTHSVAINKLPTPHIYQASPSDRFPRVPAHEPPAHVSPLRRRDESGWGMWRPANEESVREAAKQWAAVRHVEYASLPLDEVTAVLTRGSLRNPFKLKGPRPFKAFASQAERDAWLRWRKPVPVRAGRLTAAILAALASQAHDYGELSQVIYNDRLPRHIANVSRCVAGLERRAQVKVTVEFTETFPSRRLTRVELVRTSGALAAAG